MSTRAVTAVGAVLLLAGVTAPVVGAEPGNPPTEPTPLPSESVSGLAMAGSQATVGDPVADACKLFDAALSVAAANYEDFAYATAGNGNHVDYQDPEVLRTNVIGRTALRQAAAAALSAARTPGLPPAVSDPMQSWSLRATKLLLVMGLRRGGDSLNNTVTDMNTDGDNAQMACAQAALPAVSP